MVLNEPETSLHPDLLPALARLIVKTAQQTQVIVVSHAAPLIAELRKESACHSIQLEKPIGETIIAGDAESLRPVWQWPRR